MKPVVRIVLLMACALAQSPAQRDIKPLQRPTVLLQEPLSPSSDARPPKLSVGYTAEKVRRVGSVVTLSGNVKIVGQDAFLLFADEVEYQEETGVLTTKGAARIQLIAHPAKK